MLHPAIKDGKSLGCGFCMTQHAAAAKSENLIVFVRSHGELIVCLGAFPVVVRRVSSRVLLGLSAHCPRPHPPYDL